MWTRQCALPHRPNHSRPESKFNHLAQFKVIFFGFAIYFCLLIPTKVHAEEPIIAAVVVNQQPKGDFFVILKEDGDFLIRAQDLEAMGLHRLPSDPVMREGEAYLSLQAAESLDYHFDETTLTIEINAEPALLGQTTLDLSPEERRAVYYPKDDSIFLNYAADYTARDQDHEAKSLTLTNELGLRIADFLLLTETIYRDYPEDKDFIRLNSRLLYDDRNNLRRWVAGDFFAASGTLGSQVNLGGISFSKIYDIDPYFIDYPMFDFSGQLSLPSEVDIYLGGSKIHSERLDPGLFNLQNLYGRNGAQTVEVVIRDAFGRERKIMQPFYFTSNLLRRGLHEYSYNIGWVRTDFGQASDNYTGLAVSAFHRYGFRDFFNLGWRGEGSNELANVGLEAAFRISHLGLLRLEAATSRHDGLEGQAGLFSYEYSSPRFRARIGLQNYSSDYRTLADLTFADPQVRKRAILLTLGYSSRHLGSLSFDYNLAEFYTEDDRETITLSWSRKIWRRSYLNATIRQVREDSADHEVFLNLTRYFGEDYSVAASYRRDRGENVQSLEMRKQIPVGEGTGWELRAEHADRDLSEDYLLAADIQHNARLAILRGTISQGRQNTLTDRRVRAAISGALVHLGGTTALTRPVDDSYGLVTVGETEDVQVSVNGQPIGRTDSQGKIIIPDLNSYYENQVSFNDKDIPIEYLMPQLDLTVSPPLRSGSCLNFPLRKYQAFTGYILLETPRGKHPLGNAELTLVTPQGNFSFWTTQEGEFYLDSQQGDFDMMSAQGCTDTNKFASSFISSGSYPLNVRTESLTFQTELTIPNSSETYVEMGEIVLLPSQTVPAPSPSAEAAKETSFYEETPPEGTESNGTGPLESREAPTPALLSNSQVKDIIHLHFDRSNALSEDSFTLDSAMDYLKKNTDLPVEIEGYASKEPNSSDSHESVLRRILAVKDQLVEAGIEPHRIRKTLSFDKKQPECAVDEEDCLKQHRRALLIVVKSTDN